LKQKFKELQKSKKQHEKLSVVYRECQHLNTGYNNLTKLAKENLKRLLKTWKNYQNLEGIASCEEIKY
jgi:hypothetical protein